jgi:uncharacterized protein (UPF0147 family)
MADQIVSVRIPKDDLRKLQLLAEVYDQSVGAHIRTAVKKHIKKLAGTEEFRIKAAEVQQRYDEMLNQLLKPESNLPTTRKRRKG